MSAPITDADLYEPYLPLGAKVHYRRNFLDTGLADRALASLLPGGAAGIRWAQRQVNVFGWKDEKRLTAFYGEPGVRYRYSGRDNVVGADTTFESDPTGVLVEIRDLLERSLGEKFNLCLLNLYEDGSRSIGKHADDESDLVAGPRGKVIASLSLGATRTFCMAAKGKGSAAVPIPEARFVVDHGALVVMSGLTQKTLHHWVPPQRVVAPVPVPGASPTIARINLTFRRVRAAPTEHRRAA